MKLIKSVLLGLTTFFIANSALAAQINQEDLKGSKSLVVYFSRANENIRVGNIEVGNTKIVADIIKEETGSDIFEIKTVQKYPENYRECTRFAKDEKERNARPELTSDINTDDYQVIYLGYPIWWGDMPMPVYSFLDKHNLNGKIIVPFVTHEGSGVSGTDSTLQNIYRDAKILDAIEMRGKVAQSSHDQAKAIVEEYLTSQKLN